MEGTARPIPDHLEGTARPIPDHLEGIAGPYPGSLRGDWGGRIAALCRIMGHLEGTARAIADHLEGIARPLARRRGYAIEIKPESEILAPVSEASGLKFMLIVAV